MEDLLSNGLNEREIPQPSSMERGVVILKNIPHGFYEKEMFSYFSQFGRVTRIRLIRSRKTLKSKGIAFIEFEFAEVAKIVAESMNNYLMFDCILKCETVSKDKLPPKVFANWNKLRISTVDRHKRVCNADKTYESEKWSRKKKLKDINRVEKILDSAGINFKCTIVNNESCLDDTKQMLVLDSSDDDIQFKTPPATKKVWKKKKNELPGSKFEKKSMTPVSSPKKRKPVEVVTLHPQCVGRRHPTKLCLNLPKFRLLRAAARAI